MTRVELTLDELLDRWRSARTFAVVGAASIVSGGLVAAVSRPIEFGHGSWLAAYLVLVGGVAQIALGAGQAWLADGVPSRRSTMIQAVTWNVGVAAVVTGTLASLPVLTTLGGLASATALCLFIGGVHTMRPAPTVARVVYRWVAALVLLSIPIGVALAWTRHR